jgi:cardiolipin synthase
VGLYLGGRPNLSRLRAAGVDVALFVPPWQSPLRGRTNLRNHRKMIIADEDWLWTGGRNLAAAYFESGVASGAGRPGWPDLSFDLHGALAGQAQQQFEQDWRFAARESPAPTRVPQTPAHATHDALAQLVPSGPDQVDDTVHALLVSACFNARAHIVAATPYFVPDATLLMALTLAARRGVEVELLLPQRSNHWLADVARHRALRDLAVAGALVQMLPRMMHAKAVVVDDALALVGSANLDARSLFLNYELMVAFYDRVDVRRFEQWIVAQRGDALPYRSHPPGLLRRLGEGLVLWLAFQL